MTSSVIHRENGYTFYTCHSLAHIPSPLSRTLRVNKDLHLADEVNADELCRLAAQSVGRSSRNVDIFVKLAQGGFNRCRK